MHFYELIAAEHVVSSAHVSSKKRVFELIGDILAKGEAGIAQNEIFDSLQARERLGSTGLGKGVAIPHGRLKGLNKTLVAFIHLDEGIEFDSVDCKPVDLLCALLVPEESTQEHLQLLAEVAEIFRDEVLCEALRSVDSDKALFELLCHSRKH